MTLYFLFTKILPLHWVGSNSKICLWVWTYPYCPCYQRSWRRSGGTSSWSGAPPRNIWEGREWGERQGRKDHPGLGVVGRVCAGGLPPARGVTRPVGGPRGHRDLYRYQGRCYMRLPCYAGASCPTPWTQSQIPGQTGSWMYPSYLQDIRNEVKCQWNNTTSNCY